jgi:sigma-B regulation protein RsbU (phosphoserine phosphatase)
VSPKPETLEHAALSELRHNLRTPVNHILGYAELLIEDASDARNAAALDPLRQIHSTARAALADINQSLSQREAVGRPEVDALCEKIRPRLERIEQCIAILRRSAAPPEWLADLDHISHAAAAMLALFGIARPAAPVPPPEKADLQPAASRARVLVIDASPATRHLICRRLERQGYAADDAANGDDALDRIATGNFDVVLLDVRMPVPGGPDVLDRMQQDRRMRAIPVVVVSAFDDAEAVARAMERGADDFLFKPFDPVLLKARIASVLERKRLRAVIEQLRPS